MTHASFDLTGAGVAAVVGGESGNKRTLRRWAGADEVVGPTLFLSFDAGFVIGSVLLADGGWTAVDGRFMPPGMQGDAAR